jgi:hypothetical protein
MTLITDTIIQESLEVITKLKSIFKQKPNLSQSSLKDCVNLDILLNNKSTIILSLKLENYSLKSVITRFESTSLFLVTHQKSDVVTLTFS